MTDAIIDGRLVVPALPPRHIARPRLMAALDAAVEHPLTLVSAGPGSGKSVVLAAWAGARQPIPAWVSLDSTDNDPARFWAAVLGALRVAGVPGAADIATQGASGPALQPLFAAHRGDPLVLVLDDAHLLTHRELLRELDACLRRWSRQLRLIVAARSDPLLPLPRYRRAGMTELRASELAMTATESTALLAAHGVRLPQREFDILAARTEGWTAGIRLSAIRMEGADRPAEFVAEFALDQGSVGEYLMAEVLDHQPEQVRRLLIETSFLGDVNGALATAVTGIDDASSILAELSRTNSFVARADPTPDTFRYHQLLAEILRYLLHREPTERREALLGNATHWYATAGDLAHALQYAVAARDWPYVAHVLATGGFARAFVQRIDLGSLPVDALLRAGAGEQASPLEVTVAAASLLAGAGHADEARGRLDQVGVAPVTDELAGTLALTRLLIARAEMDVAGADTAAERLVGGLDRALAAAARLEQAMTHFYAGRHDTVAALLRKAVADARAAGNPGLELECLSQLAHVNAFWGELHTAVGFESRANELIRRNPALTAPPSLLVATAERALTKADLAGAVRAARTAVRMSIDDADLRAEVAMLQTLLWGLTGRTVDVALAPQVPERGRGLIAEYHLTLLALAESARGRPNAAIRLLRSALPARPDGIAAVALSQAHLARGDLAEARAALRPVLRNSEQRANRMCVVSALLSDAEIAATGGDDRRAVQIVVRAIDLADNEIDLPFVSASSVLTELRSREAALDARWPTAAEASDPASGAEIDDELVGTIPAESLTDRERAVLRWLATTMSTNEIADELCLSVNTVKTHIATIYRKLGSARRRDAVSRAREFELL